jgi:hypothetical protein
MFPLELQKDFVYVTLERGGLQSVYCVTLNEVLQVTSQLTHSKRVLELLSFSCMIVIPSYLTPSITNALPDTADKCEERLLGMQ